MEKAERAAEVFVFGSTLLATIMAVGVGLIAFGASDDGLIALGSTMIAWPIAWFGMLLAWVRS